MDLAIGADPFGVELKNALVEHLREAGHQVTDLGGAPSQDRAYYSVADEAARLVAASEVSRAVLICGTGMGMSIIANKHKGVFAAVCEHPDVARKARSINNANVLTLGAMFTAASRAKEIVDAFLSTEFKAGWDEGICTFLDQSMRDIDEIETRVFREQADGANSSS